MYWLLTFENTHTAIETRKNLSSRFPVRTIPTLREISASCGISLRIAPEYQDPLNAFLDENTLNPKMYALYRIDTDEITDKVTGFEKIRP